MRFGVVLKWFGVVWCVFGWFGVFPRSGSILGEERNDAVAKRPGFYRTTDSCKHLLNVDRHGYNFD